MGLYSGGLIIRRIFVSEIFGRAKFRRGLLLNFRVLAVHILRGKEQKQHLSPANKTVRAIKFVLVYHCVEHICNATMCLLFIAEGITDHDLDTFVDMYREHCEVGTETGN